MNNNIQDSADNPGVVAPPPLIYAIPLLAGILLHLASPRKFLPFSPIARILGVICVGTGMATISAGFRTMRQAGTNIDPRQPATTVVTSGPFRFTRNLLYLSLALLYSGIALFLNSAWPMLFLPFVLIFSYMLRDQTQLSQHGGRVIVGTHFCELSLLHLIDFSETQFYAATRGRIRSHL